MKSNVGVDSEPVATDSEPVAVCKNDMPGPPEPGPLAAPGLWGPQAGATESIRERVCNSIRPIVLEGQGLTAAKKLATANGNQWPLATASWSHSDNWDWDSTSRSFIQPQQEHWDSTNAQMHTNAHSEKSDTAASSQTDTSAWNATNAPPWRCPAPARVREGCEGLTNLCDDATTQFQKAKTDEKASEAGSWTAGQQADASNSQWATEDRKWDRMSTSTEDSQWATKDRKWDRMSTGEVEAADWAEASDKWAEQEWTMRPEKETTKERRMRTPAAKRSQQHRLKRERRDAAEAAQPDMKWARWERGKTIMEEEMMHKLEMTHDQKVRAKKEVQDLEYDQNSAR